MEQNALLQEIEQLVGLDPNESVKSAKKGKKKPSKK